MPIGEHIYQNKSFKKAFWEKLESLVKSSEVIIDRKKGLQHPRYPEMVYPVDYGYLKSTKSSDNNEIDVWAGTEKNKNVDAIVCTVDTLKRDSEIKLLLGCTYEEKQTIMKFHNQTDYMSAILLERK